MAKMGCAKCGKMMKKGGAKKMAKGGSNQSMGIYGIPQEVTGTSGQYGLMKKGGMKKAKFGASVPVRHSPPVGMRHKDSRIGFESVASAKVGGSLKPVPSDKVGLSKLPTAVRNKMGYQKSGGTMKKAVGGPILDKLKAKATERKITRQIKKSVKNSGKIIK